ncbi:hypothetical protein D3C73_1286600 [compost metagenome]
MNFAMKIIEIMFRVLSVSIWWTLAGRHIFTRTDIQQIQPVPFCTVNQQRPALIFSKSERESTDIIMIIPP